MSFATLSQLKSRVWSSREDAEADLKRSALAPETATYRISQFKSGKFYLEDIEPASKDAKQAEVVQLNTGKQKKPLARIKQAAPVKDAKAPASAKPEAPAKAAKPPADPLKGGPDPAKLPNGFDAWAVEQAMSKDGVFRTELRKKSGIDCKWFGYLKQIAAAHNCTATMERVGRLTLFRMKSTAAATTIVKLSNVKQEAAAAKAVAASTKKAAAAQVAAAKAKPAEKQVTPRFRKGATKEASASTKH